MTWGVDVEKYFPFLFRIIFYSVDLPGGLMPEIAEVAFLEPHELALDKTGYHYLDSKLVHPLP